MSGATLTDMRNVKPTGEADEEFLALMADFLRQHGMEDRWGAALLHGHHGIGADEVFLELPGEGRSLVTTPVRRDKVPADAVTTIWDLSGPDPVAVSQCGGPYF